MGAEIDIHTDGRNLVIEPIDAPDRRQQLKTIMDEMKQRYPKSMRRLAGQDEEE